MSAVRLGPYRATIPALEALMRAGNIPVASDLIAGQYDILLSHPPRGLVVVRILNTADIGLRLPCEPPYPGEVAAAWHEVADFTACHCGSALLWDEAGRVPGARLCLDGHRVQLSDDGARVRRAAGRRW